MTDFNAWDRKAASLVKEAEKEDEEEKRQADEALGLQDGPQGPPVAQAKAQRKEMGTHSQGRKHFIAEQQAREVVITRKDEDEPIVVTPEEVAERALRLRDCENVTFVFPKGLTLVKLFVESCRKVTLRLGCQIKTSFLEINHTADCEVRAECPVATTQCDECTEGFLRIVFLEPEDVGAFFHQNSPALEVAVQGQDPVKIGVASQRQLCTRPGPSGEMLTEEVSRGEKEFPMNLSTPAGTRCAADLEAESLPSSEEDQARAEAKRVEGNEAFKASDFLQAAVFYTEAIQLCAELHLAWANRAQCFLKTGQPEKALTDATRCTELAPAYAKGWFRKGMALHAMERFGAAIPALVQAEKLDPKNEQIPDAIRMAQMMCRKKGPGEEL